MDDRVIDWQKDPQSASMALDAIKGGHTSRLALDRDMISLYYSRPQTDYGVRVGSVDHGVVSFSDYEAVLKPGFNVSCEVVDTAIAVICNKMTSKVTPVGKDPSVARACKKLRQFDEGLVEQLDFYAKATEVARHAAFSSCPGMLFYEEDDELQCRLVPSTGVFWDRSEGPDPYTVYLEYQGSRYALKARFPNHAKAIDDAASWAPRAIHGATDGSRKTGDGVRVVEIIRRKVGARPGRRVVAIDGAALLNQPWTYDFLPVVLYPWSPDYEGAGGVPLVRRLAPYHLYTIKCARALHKSARGAIPMVAYSVFDPIQGISDEPFQGLPYENTPPQITTPRPMSDQLITWIGILRERAFAEAGVSAQVAQGVRPAGLNSAPAQREWLDMANIRSKQARDQWEKFWERCARVRIGMAAQMYSDKKRAIRAPGSDVLLEINWKEIDLEENKYSLKYTSASSLSITPAGRVQQVLELKSEGLIDAKTAARMVELADTREIADRINAAADLAEKMVDEAIDEAKFTMPDPMQGAESLRAIVEYGTQRLQMTMMSAVEHPWQNVETLRRIIIAAKETLEPSPMAQELVPPAIVEAMPPALPMAAPAPAVAAPIAPPIPMPGPMPVGP